VLVHGGISDHSYWDPVRAALEARFSVYAIERRGRGNGDDAQPYAIEREYEDVAAVVASTGEPTHLLGHSYGAVCGRRSRRPWERLRRT
jgi:pimeloyl-ACP methyl ester carboxylesterase